MVKRFSLGANSESVWERHPKCVKTGDRGKKGNETQSIYARGEIWIAIGIPLVLKKKHVNIPFDCCCLITQSRPTLWSHGLQHPRLPVLHYLPEFAQIHIHWIDDTIQPSHPLSPSSPLAFNLSQHQDLFQWICSSHRWPQYWSFSLNISPSNEYSGLISFRIDWFDLQLGSPSFLQGIFQTQGLNLGLLHCRYILYCLSHQGSLMIYHMYM